MTDRASPLPMSLAEQLNVLSCGSFSDRWQVSQVLSQQGSGVVPGLLELVMPVAGEFADAELCWFVTRILGQIEHPAVIPGLLRLLDHPQADVQHQAMSSLTNLGPRAIPVLSELLTNPNLRYLAVRGLVGIDHPAIITPLLTVAGDANAQVREAVLMALSRYSNPEILEILYQGLADSEPGVRRSAIRGLGRVAITATPVQQAQLSSELATFLWDLNAEVCLQAAIALGRLGTSAAITALFERLHSPAPADLQRQMIQALGQIGTPQALQYLQQLLLASTTFFARSTGNPDVAITGGLSITQAQQEIIALLGRLESARGQAFAAQVLLQFLRQEQSPSVPLRQSLAYSLGQLRQPESREALTNLLVDPHGGVRLHAEAALRQLPSQALE